MHRVTFSVSLALLLCAASLPLLAADSTQSTPSFPGAGIGALVMWYVCSSRKQKEIGGWLLYYYIQLYLGVLVSIVVFAASWSAYLPGTWSAAPELYPMFLVSTVPGLLVLPAQLVAAELLRMSRDARWIRVLRYVLWADLLLACLATAVDMKYFPNDLVFDVLGLIWPIVWLPYFYVSSRVNRVFRLKDWLPAPAPAAT